MKPTLLLLLLPCLAIGRPRSMMDNWVDYPKAQFVTTKQDHFDPYNDVTWKQAYYVNDTFWTPGSDAPIFLCVGGGEALIDGSVVVNSTYCNNAVEWLSEKKALMFALEHRYYGCHQMKACPVINFDDEIEALKFLSSRQAIEDVENFVREMNKKYNLSKKNKWVTWGGSYAGSLAGWSRAKHSDLIHASVASSAPVLAKLDIREYNNILAKAYSVSDNGVGGSQACEDAIRYGHQKIDITFQSAGGSRYLEKVFGLPKNALKSEDAQKRFAGKGVAKFPAADNDPLCTEPACNIKSICEIMLDESKEVDEVQRLADVRKLQKTWMPKKDELERGLAYLPDFWKYQTCTEFGFYKTCEVGSECFFTQGYLTLKFFEEECKKWNISREQTEKGIEATNEHYGGKRPTGTDDTKLAKCVMWVNGEVDPWLGLSVVEEPNAEQTVLMISGASHRTWTHPSGQGDQPSVVAGRLTIRRQVEKFLNMSCTEDNVVLV